MYTGQRELFLHNHGNPMGPIHMKKTVIWTKSKRRERKLHESLEGLAGVACMADDILVYRSDQISHDFRLTELIKRCEQKHISLNKH